MKEEEICFQEDEGDRDADDADTAVLQSKTGHTVHKKKEWYIWYQRGQIEDNQDL